MRILHVLIREFYLTLERARRRLPLDTEMIIHFPEEPNFVVASSAAAAAHGVRRRMTMDQAKKRWPDGLFIPADYSSYERASERLNATIRDAFPFSEQINSYEWFCDISDAPPEDFREKLLAQMRRVGPFSVDFSVARNKFLAKLGNDTGQDFDVPSVQEVLKETPLERFWGIPKKWIIDLKTMGIGTIGDVAGVDVSVLDKKFSQKGRRLVRLGRGEDDHEVLPFSKPVRLSRDGRIRLSDGLDEHKKILKDLTLEISEQLQKGGHVGFSMMMELAGEGKRVSHRYRFLLPTIRPSSLLVGSMSMLRRMKETLPADGTWTVTVAVTEIVCDRERYHLHGSPRTDFELMTD